ncbi:hypothetical protein GUJ93_ZPchr0001g31378 [Zizania palustris]|uniref:Polygalacturonase n=1 Tax=Zizania palustris TaxID=103762 RepID=A0A8J5RNJ3_ZIZPA|nr:hypothetical protein GUJ93_ZPchr0001g31378 [Zizania palustris]
MNRKNSALYHIFSDQVRIQGVSTRITMRVWMAAKYTLLLFLLVLAIRSVRSEAPQQRVYNVLDFHAAGDGNKDDTQAFLATWVAACSDTSQPIMIIPGGRTFLLSQVRFSGNCMSPIKIQLDGNIVAPNSIWTSEEANLITFYQVNSLTLDGNGQIDGKGDDCISMLSYTTDVNITDSICGPGHGIRTKDEIA